MMVLVKKHFKGSIETLKIRGMMVAFGNASGPLIQLMLKKILMLKDYFLQDHQLHIIHQKRRAC